MSDYKQALLKLKEYNQEQVLDFYDSLTEQEKHILLSQIDDCNFSVINSAFRNNEPKLLSPLNVLTKGFIDKNYNTFDRIGINALKSGNTAVLILAGGQASRLGIDSSKGCIDIGITRHIYIFECLINNIMESVKKSQAWIPLYIMTSALNCNEIINFLALHNYFGYNKDYVKFFQQKMNPATDYNGKILMAEKHLMAMSPDGTGGFFRSLAESEVYTDISERKIKWLNCVCIDNVLQKSADTAFLGAVISGNYKIGTKVIKKRDYKENLGIVCKVNNVPSVIEYYEMSDKDKMLSDNNGNLVYQYGVTLNYYFSVSELERICGNKLPVHKADKRILHIDRDGNHIIPQHNNGYKYEYLIHDLISMSGSLLPFEVDRDKEFAPIKNKSGNDSIDTAQDQLLRIGIKL